MASNDLLNKYNIPVPRYTSYPTVPYWNESIAINEWVDTFKHQFQDTNASKGISLYIHLPFCESLCTYCGCNKKITQNHSVELVYINAVLKEWKMYLSLMSQVPVIKELHLGGGTPTFFSPENLEYLITTILSDCFIPAKHDFSVEGHPNNTTREHLEMFYKLGFRRISYGVQDNDPEVQHIINRIQPFENVKHVTELARAIGFTSINFDLIYGLPLQSIEKMERTVLQTISLRPDRIAFYSYAHVPWVSRGQRLFDELDLPNADLKLKLYQSGKKLFIENGYHDIGMDHFALITDDLYKASVKGLVHRNFMGYTTHTTEVLLGLGVSAISDTGNAYAQNEKTIHNYYQKLNQNKLPVIKGYFLTEEDKAFKKYILDLICRGQTLLLEANIKSLTKFTYPKIEELVNDGLVEWMDNSINITSAGKSYLRNICSAFDLHLLQYNKSEKTFSSAI